MKEKKSEAREIATHYFHPFEDFSNKCFVAMRSASTTKVEVV
jgi:hypothetical protein